MQVHAEGKTLDRDGDAEYETDALLSQTAAINIGYSGAELENLLNEAAILTVSVSATLCPQKYFKSHAARVHAVPGAASGYAAAECFESGPLPPEVCNTRSAAHVYISCCKNHRNSYTKAVQIPNYSLNATH